MIFLPNERVALFIDGANLYSASRNLGFDVDYRNLLEYFRRKANIIRAYYYSALLETEEYSPLKPLTDWLAYNGYSLVTKPAKEFTDAMGRRRVKGNMDIEIAVDMLELAPTARSRRAVQWRRRFPPAGGGGAAQGGAGLGDLLHPHQPADGGRRAAPPGRPVRRARRHRRRVHPPADRAPGAATGAADPGRTVSRAVALTTRERSRHARPGLPAVPAAGRVSRRPTGPRIRTGGTRRCQASARWMRRCWWSGWRRGCAGRTAPAVRSPATMPAMLLYQTLLRFGFARGVFAARADDGLTLAGCRVTNAVRCVPPENRPLPAEVAGLPPVPGRGAGGDDLGARGAGAGGSGARRRCCAPGGCRWRAPCSATGRCTRCRAGRCWPTATMSRATTRTPGG